MRTNLDKINVGSLIAFHDIVFFVFKVKHRSESVVKLLGLHADGATYQRDIYRRDRYKILCER